MFGTGYKRNMYTPNLYCSNFPTHLKIAISTIISLKYMCVYWPTPFCFFVSPMDYDVLVLQPSSPLESVLFYWWLVWLWHMTNLHELPVGLGSTMKMLVIEQTNPSIIMVPVSSYFLPICVKRLILQGGFKGRCWWKMIDLATQLFHLIAEGLENKDKKGRVIISIQLWMKEQTYERHHYDHAVVSFWVWARMSQQPTRKPLMERMLYDSVVDELQLSWYSVSSS